MLNSASPAAAMITQTRLTRLWSHMLQTTVVTHRPWLFPSLLPQFTLSPPLKNSSVLVLLLLLLLLFQLAGDLNGPHQADGFRIVQSWADEHDH